MEGESQHMGTSLLGGVAGSREDNPFPGVSAGLFHSLSL